MNSKRVDPYLLQTVHYVFIPDVLVCLSQAGIDTCVLHAGVHGALIISGGRLETCVLLQSFSHVLYQM